MSSLSPRTNGSNESPDRSPSKRSRVKLSKTNGQTLRQTLNFATEKTAQKQQPETESSVSKQQRNPKEKDTVQQKKIDIQLVSSELKNPQNNELKRNQPEYSAKTMENEVEIVKVATKNAPADNDNSNETKQKFVQQQ